MTAPPPASVSASPYGDVSSPSIHPPCWWHLSIFASCGIFLFTPLDCKHTCAQLHTHTQNIRSRSYQEHMSWMDFHFSSIATQSRVPVLCSLWGQKLLHCRSKSGPKSSISRHEDFLHFSTLWTLSLGLKWTCLKYSCLPATVFKTIFSINCLASSFRA